MMQCRPLSWRIAIAALLSATVLLPRTAHAEVRTCTRAINLAAAKFVRLQYKALRRCNDGVLKGTRPGPCPDARTTTRLAKLDTKLRASIETNCGGTDRHCGSGVDDDSLASIGWNIGACPNFENGSCTNAIADCRDVADCLKCVGRAAVAQSIALSYDDLDHMQQDAHVRGCQRVIGKNTERFFSTKMNALRKCNERVILGYSNGPCPDAIAIAAIAKAEVKKVRGICKFCGGGDKRCGTADDLTPATIGFSANCPNVTVPGGPACAAPISDMQAIVDCVDCVAEFKADCVDALAAPTVESYPPECNGGTSATVTPLPPTPTLTATSTPTATPTPTLTVPLPTFTAPVPTLTAPLPTVTLPLPTATPPGPTVTLPLPTVTLPLPTVTLPLPTVTLPLPTITLPLPTITLPLPTITLPLPTITLPLPTITLPLPTITLPLPTITLPLPTATPAPTFTLDLPTITLALPTATPAPTFTLPLPTTTPAPTITLPLPTTTPAPTITLPLPTTTPAPTTTLPLPTTTPAPTSTLPLPTTTPAPTITLPLPTTTPAPTITLPLPTTTPLPTVTSTPLPATATVTSTPLAATPTPTRTATHTPTPTPTSTPVCGNGTIEPGEVCELPGIGCSGLLPVCLLCTQCAP